MTMPQRTIRVRVEERDDLDAAYTAAENSAVAIRATSDRAATGAVTEQIEPITAVLVGVGVSIATAKFVLDWWDHRRGGLVIDMRPTAVDQISRDRNVPWGYVIVFAADGSAVKVETKDQPRDAVERWVSGVITGAFKSATLVAQEAGNAVGDEHVEEIAGEGA